MSAEETHEDLKARVRSLSAKTQALFERIDAYVDATDAELQLLRAVADAADKHMAQHGNVQLKEPLHCALEAWHLHRRGPRPK